MANIRGVESTVGRGMVDPKATATYLAMRARLRNPDTGQLPTHKELSKDFRLHPDTIGRKLRVRGVYRHPYPKVRQDELPENQKAFFLGLALGDFQRGLVHWGKKGFVYVETQSRDEYRRELLRLTFGIWGDIHERSNGVKIYVSSPQFDFTLNPRIDKKYLETKNRFAPLLFGTLAARLSDERDRLSLSNEGLLRRMHGKFLTNFGFSIGPLNVEHRNEDGGIIDVSVISVRNPGEVFVALAQVRSVHTLPFFRSVTTARQVTQQ